MAIFVAFEQFNQDGLDLYDLLRYYYDQGLGDNLDQTSTVNFGGSDFTYYTKDSFWSQWKVDGKTYSTAFMSENDISWDGANAHTLTGTVNHIGTVRLLSGGGNYDAMWGIADIDVDIQDLYSVAITETTSDDTQLIAQILSGADNFYLSEGSDLTRGYGGNDIMYGYGGNDTLYGGNNNDKLYGGNNNDKLYGGNNNDKLYGGSGNDRSYGQSGNDRLYMDAGNDRLDGGSGTDWLYVTGRTNSVVNLAKTTGQNTGYGTDIIKNIENASGGSGVDKFYGTSGNNTLKGNNGNDVLSGKSGNDKLYGGNNNDKLYGGSGNDRSYGQSGNDSLYMDAGNDTLDGGSGTDWLYVTGRTNSVVNLAKTTGQNTGYGTDIIKNIENASGGSGVDKFYGTSGNNSLKGNNGNDLLYGQNGNDTLYGGNNNDKLYGGSGNDLLKGDAGRDILQGDAGKDSLYGGADADTFVFRTTSHSSASASRADIIRDFTRGSDKIDLHYIDASTKLSGNNAFTFDGTTSFGTSKQGDIYYKKFNYAGTSKDYTMVYIDTDNDRGTEMSIKLMGLHTLTADDFIL